MDNQFTIEDYFYDLEKFFIYFKEEMKRTHNYKMDVSEWDSLFIDYFNKYIEDVE